MLYFINIMIPTIENRRKIKHTRNQPTRIHRIKKNNITLRHHHHHHYHPTKKIVFMCVERKREREKNKMYEKYMTGTT